jgi:dTDP-4-dehydrorhamnose reductase
MELDYDSANQREVRILVIGTSGFIGGSFRRLKKDMFLCTSRSATSEEIVSFDPSRDDLRRFAFIDSVTHALLLFAEREPDVCAAHPAQTRTVNIDHAMRVIDQCKDIGVVPMFSSSELVFDGVGGMFTEHSPPKPILEYGHQKLEVEQYLLTSGTDGVVLRFPKTVGVIAGDRSLFTNWMAKVREGETVVDCAFDQYFSIQWVDEVPVLVERIASTGVTGVIHLGDGTRHSRRELLDLLWQKCKQRGLQTPRVRELSIDDFAALEKRPKDVSLATARLSRIVNHDRPTIDEMLEKVVVPAGERQQS